MVQWKKKEKKEKNFDPIFQEVFDRFNFGE